MKDVFTTVNGCGAKTFPGRDKRKLSRDKGLPKSIEIKLRKAPANRPETENPPMSLTPGD